MNRNSNPLEVRTWIFPDGFLEFGCYCRLFHIIMWDIKEGGCHMVNFDEVLTFSEAAEKWGLADGKTIRKAVERNRFQPHEIKKSGNVWLTTYDAMYRVFGEPRNELTTLYYFDLAGQGSLIPELLKDFSKRARSALAQGKMVRIAESEQHPEKVLIMIKSIEELEDWEHRMQFYGS